MVSTQTDGNKVWPSVFRDYHQNHLHKYNTQDSCLIELQEEFYHIKKQGFNTLRLVQFGEEFFEKESKRIYIRASLGNRKDTSLYLDNKALYAAYIKGTQQLFSLAEKAGLKVIYLLRTKPEYPETEQHVFKYISAFKTDTNILAWDLFNEPLYFDSIQRPKKEVVEITRNWRKQISNSAPNHLYTIGLTGIREMFEWDPNIIDVDFISYHPYEYEHNQVINEMLWYKDHVTKPWIIGETAIPADGDSIPFTNQAQFAKLTLKQTLACGGIGYSWWQFKDVQWNDFHSDYMGVANMDTTYYVENIELQIKDKPIVNVFKEFAENGFVFDDLQQQQPSNFYNYSNFNTFSLKGKIVDKDGKPLASGVVLAWNEWWSKSYVTTCKEDGTFELKGPFKFFHWIASASKHTMIRNDINPDTATFVNGIPTIDLGTIQIEPLDL